MLHQINSTTEVTCKSSPFHSQESCKRRREPMSVLRGTRLELPRGVFDPFFMGDGRAGKGFGRRLTMLLCRVGSFDYAGLMAAEVASFSLDWQLHLGR